jgi:hypothetical protein
VALASEKPCDPTSHAALAADDDSTKRVTEILGVAVYGLLLDRFADQKGREVSTQDRVEAEQRARILEPLIDLRLDFEISERNPGRAFELADLASQLEPFANQVQNAPVEGLDVTPVLLEKLSRAFGW